MVETCGIFIINKEKKVLLIHPTFHSGDVWSIPKGRKEENESSWEAALREVKEETNFTLNTKESIFQVEKIYDNKKKKLVAFFVETSDDVTNYPFECISFFERKGKQIPECDKFQWFTLEEAKKVVHKTQTEAIEEFEKLKKIAE